MIIRYDDNAAVVIDQEGNPKGTQVFGAIAQELRQFNFTKIISLAPEEALPGMKEQKWIHEGLITESLPNGMFRVRLDNENMILGYVSGKIRRSFIRILPVDRVKIEEYDSKSKISINLYSSKKWIRNETMLKKGSRGRIGSRKSIRKIPKGVIHIQESFNNTIVTITDIRGRVVSWSSA
ncbi:hypothetical protein R6Q57_018549, partial [Mikania cordata]